MATGVTIEERLLETGHWLEALVAALNEANEHHAALAAQKTVVQVEELRRIIQHEVVSELAVVTLDGRALPPSAILHPPSGSADG